MMGPKSKKAMYVHLQAPVFCDIWFICKGHLINRRYVLILVDFADPST